MVTPSNPMNIQSLVALYTLGITAGGAVNLIVRDSSSSVQEEIIYSLGATLSALTTSICWKYISDDVNVQTSSDKISTVVSKEDKLSRDIDKLVIPLLVSSLGLSPSKVLNLIIGEGLNKKEIFSLSAGVTILAISKIWKHLFKHQIGTNVSSNLKKTNLELTKLTAPMIVALGMLSGINLSRHPLSSILRGAVTMGLTLYIRDKEKQGILQWRDFLDF